MCDWFACLSVNQTLTLNMLKEHPAFSFSLLSPQPCTGHGCVLCLICLGFLFSLWAMRKTWIYPTEFWILSRGSQARSLSMAKRSWVSLGAAQQIQRLKCLSLSLSLWIREEPMEMGSQLGPSVQDLQPGRINPSSGMQPHPVSTGNTGWPLTPLHCPHHIFLYKTPLQEQSRVRTEDKAPHIQTLFPPLSNKQHSLSFYSFSQQGIHTSLSTRRARRQHSWQGCQL